MSPRPKKLTERQERQRARRLAFWAEKRGAARTSEDKALVAFAEVRARIADLHDAATCDEAWRILAVRLDEARDAVMDLLPAGRR